MSVLGHRATQPDEHHGPEHRVPAGAHDEVHPGRGHRFDQHRLGPDRVEGLVELGRCAYPETHAADLGLVQHGRVEQLDRDGPAQLGERPVRGTAVRADPPGRTLREQALRRRDPARAGRSGGRN